MSRARWPAPAAAPLGRPGRRAACGVAADADPDAGSAAGDPAGFVFIWLRIDFDRRMELIYINFFVN